MTARPVWNAAYRREIWSTLSNGAWDLVIVGGGITGAGILREAARLNLRTLLVEQSDFAWGTSSRSSKLVHGGLRYLKTGQVALTHASVQGREQLLAEGSGLIDPLGFLLAQYENDGAGGGRLIYGAGLTVYDLMAQQWSHRYYSPQDFQMMAPYIAPTGLRGGFQYQDAQTDDARLVLRVMREAADEGGVAINYVRAERLLFDGTDEPTGVRLRNVPDGSTVDVTARVIINATGAWADTLRKQVGGEERIRPLRGSHLIFPAWRFPLAQAVSFMHPVDGRPVFAFPWEGVTLVGTTDVDCPPPLDNDPSITADEVAYLLAAVAGHFPALNLTHEDVLATFAGIRPVIGSGKDDPSDESRDHVIWSESGLLTVTGGKLTTFRQVARQALEAVCVRLDDQGTEAGKSRLARLHEGAPILRPLDDGGAILEPLPGVVRQRLLGRYGADAAALVAAAQPGEMESIAGTVALWAELRWAARAEAVVHLDDLLLRRVRVGLLAPKGGVHHLRRIRRIVQPELGWDDTRWEAEASAYQKLIDAAYSLPDETIPDWRGLLIQSRAAQAAATAVRRQRRRSIERRAGLGFLVVALGALWLWVRWRRRVMVEHG
ncbi:MAG: glycerol-3-phosphate dehydrogenase/oxidase [Anaerolineae bacterium]|nr:glycerol-3-phosphate dehydrogenase/oxidase [Anaerolineales bacterium]MCB8934695.1 glycerol-3-phosphate dehydrogenase/oxidase [Promineifilum sp.]MCW5846691.1 glycerol-3-phosphate dehydrogenase/oxidase [Anaerolineae bacterium]